MTGQEELVTLIYSLLKERKLIIWMVAISTIMGMTYAVLKQNEYEVSVTMIPKNVASTRLGRFGGLASLAGLNLNSSGELNSVSPQHYSYLTNSVPFMKGLLQFEVYSESLDSNLSVKDYITTFRQKDKLGWVKSNTIGLPLKLIVAIKGTHDDTNKLNAPSDTLFVVTKDESNLISYLKDRINIEYDQIEGTLHLTSNMPEATVATQLSLYVQNHLSSELVRIQRDFELKSLDFMEELYKIKKIEFEEIQRELAEFEDRNRNISSAVARSQLRKLESEYELAFNVYSEVAQQFESKKIDVLNNLPAYSVIKPAVVPNNKVSPKRITICLVSVIVGVIIGVFLALAKILLISFRAEFRAKLEPS